MGMVTVMPWFPLPLLITTGREQPLIRASLPAAAAALACAHAVGPRTDLGKTPMIPNNLPMTLFGGGLLWFGWFGFNAGSALAANALAGHALVTTHLATAAGIFGWILLEYMRFGKAPVLEVTPQDVDEIRQLFQLIKTMLRSDKERYRHEIIRTLFTTAFYIITEINQREQPGEMKQGRCEVLFDEFMSLLQQYNKRERNVSFYAKQLNITPKYLSSVVKEVSGKTAARWIDESVILEAKALLKYSGMSIQEIAYHLNFSTQSFFGKYFKQHTGTSPSRYKRKG